jgi:hypothetical protein
MEQPVFYIEEPAEFRLEGGLVRAELRSGEQVIHLAGSVNTFLASFRRMAEVAAQWRGGAAEIIEFERATH